MHCELLTMALTYCERFLPENYVQVRGLCWEFLVSSMELCVIIVAMQLNSNSAKLDGGATRGRHIYIIVWNPFTSCVICSFVVFSCPNMYKALNQAD